MIAAQMISALSALAMSDLLPLRSLLQVLKDGEILPADFDIDAAEKQLEAAEARKLAFMDNTSEEEGGGDEEEEE